MGEWVVWHASPPPRTAWITAENDGFSPPSTLSSQRIRSHGGLTLDLFARFFSFFFVLFFLPTQLSVLCELCGGSAVSAPSASSAHSAVDYLFSAVHHSVSAVHYVIA